MQSLDPLGEYSDDVVRAALRGQEGSRELSYRYERLSASNVLLGELDTVLSGSVSQNALADIKRTAQFEIADPSEIDYLQDRIKPYARIEIPRVEEYREYVTSLDPSLWYRMDEPNPGVPTGLTGVIDMTWDAHSTPETAYDNTIDMNSSSVESTVPATAQFIAISSTDAQINTEASSWSPVMTPKVTGLRGIQTNTAPTTYTRTFTGLTVGKEYVFGVSVEGSGQGVVYGFVGATMQTVPSLSGAFSLRGKIVATSTTHTFSLQLTKTVAAGGNITITEWTLATLEPLGDTWVKATIQQSRPLTFILGRTDASFVFSAEPSAGSAEIYYSSPGDGGELVLLKTIDDTTSPFYGLNFPNPGTYYVRFVGLRQAEKVNLGIVLNARIIDSSRNARHAIGLTVAQGQKQVVAGTGSSARIDDTYTMYTGIEGGFVPEQNADPDADWTVSFWSAPTALGNFVELGSYLYRGFRANSATLDSQALGVYVGWDVASGGVRTLEVEVKLTNTLSSAPDITWSTEVAAPDYTGHMVTVSREGDDVVLYVDAQERARILFEDRISKKPMTFNTQTLFAEDRGPSGAALLDDVVFFFGRHLPRADIFNMYSMGTQGVSVGPGGQSVFAPVNPGRGYVEWPLGVFLLTSPTRTLVDGTVVSRSVEAYDQLLVLQDDVVVDRYTVTAGTRYTDAISTLTAALPSRRITPSTRTLPVAVEWDPGTPKLKIINDLLSSLNYDSAWFDENGFFVAQPYVTPSGRPSEYTYATDETSLITGDVNQTLDLFDVPNRWVLVVSEADRPPLRGIFTNTSPSSPTSTVSRGRVITDFRTEQKAADIATLNAKAARLAYEASQIYEIVEFNTASMPIHSHSDVYIINIPGLALDAKFSEHTWDLTLEPGAPMKHKARRIISLEA